MNTCDMYWMGHYTDSPVMLSKSDIPTCQGLKKAEIAEDIGT